MVNSFIGIDYEVTLNLLQESDPLAMLGPVESAQLRGNVRGYRDTDFSFLKLSELRTVLIVESVTHEQFTQICTATQLESLVMWDVRKIETLEPIQQLSNLRKLSLVTPASSDPKSVTMPSIEPLTTLEGLEALMFTSFKFADEKGIKPLELLKNLQEIHVPYKFVDQALALPHLTNENKQDLAYFKASIEGPRSKKFDS